MKRELSPAELRIARALVAGMSNPEAAAYLSRSVRTIENQRLRISLKLGAATAVELGYILARMGIEPIDGQGDERPAAVSADPRGQRLSD